MVVDYSKIQVDRTQPLDVGNVVWVRLDGYPWWPAIVVNRKEREPGVELEEGEKLAPESQSNRMVEFFNDEGRVAVIQVNDICEYTTNMKLVRQSGKPRKDVIKACREANHHIETKGTRAQTIRYSGLPPFEDYIRPRNKQPRNGPGSSADVSMDGYDDEDDDDEDNDGRIEVSSRRKGKIKRKSESARKPDSGGTESLPRRRNSDIPRKSKKRVDKHDPVLANAPKEGRLAKSGSYRSREHSSNDMLTDSPPSRKHGSGLSPNSRVPSSRPQSLTRNLDPDTPKSEYRNRDSEPERENGSQTARYKTNTGSKKNRCDSERTSRKRDSDDRGGTDHASMTEKPPRKRHKGKSRWSDGPEHDSDKREPREEKKYSKRVPDSGKRPRTEDFSDSDSEESSLDAYPRRESKVVSETKREDEVSDGEGGSQMEPVDNALAMDKSKTDDVIGDFDCDIVDESDIGPDSDSGSPSREELSDQFEKFQMALIQYHDDLLEMEYFRKLELEKFDQAKKKRQILIAEIQKLKKVSVSRDTLNDTGVREKLSPFIQTLKNRTPRLVEDMNLLAKYWASHVKVGKFRSKPARSIETKTSTVGRVQDGGRKAGRKSEERIEGSTKVAVDKIPNATVSSPKVEDNMKRKVKTEEMEVDEDEKHSGGNSARVKKNSVEAKRSQESTKFADDKQNEAVNVPKTEDVVPVGVESMKESRVAERAKLFKPETNLKALSVLIKSAGRSDEEITRMTGLVEREIRNRAKDEKEYYSLSVRIIKTLKKKSNIEKLWTSNSAAHLFSAI